LIWPSTCKCDHTSGLFSTQFVVESLSRHHIANFQGQITGILACSNIADRQVCIGEFPVVYLYVSVPIQRAESGTESLPGGLETHVLCRKYSATLTYPSATLVATEAGAGLDTDCLPFFPPLPILSPCVTAAAFELGPSWVALDPPSPI
jgi:hypothetical protein